MNNERRGRAPGVLGGLSTVLLGEGAARLLLKYIDCVFVLHLQLKNTQTTLRLGTQT